MHDESYASIVEAADKLRDAIVDHFEAWEDDADYGSPPNVPARTARHSRYSATPSRPHASRATSPTITP